MAGDFGERIDELMERVGHGDLVGSVVIDQRYAAVQHNSLDFEHPRGGQALYLQQPLMEHHEDYLRKIAGGILDDGGKRAMEEVVEDLAEDGGVARLAPLEFGDLRDSGHPSVTEDGAVVYDREPRQHRLSDEELKAKYRLHHPHVSTLTAKQRAFLYANGILGREA
jgi:hypothetical protein